MSEDAVTLTTDDLIVVVRAAGGRIERLYSRRDDREWLSVPATREESARAPATYADTEHFGWDEMLPSVDPSVYVGSPYDGVVVPDHGELWSTQWEIVEVTATSVHQRVLGQRFDYAFERRLELAGPTVRASYQCAVSSAMSMLWALHPQFVSVEGTRLEMDEIGPHWYAGVDGELRETPWRGDLVVERDLAAGSDQNYYVDPLRRSVRPRLVDPNGATLALDWDRDFAPYLVVWADHRHLTSGRVIAIEPMSGFYDDLARAQRSDRISSFTPDAPRAWWVEITVTPGGE